MTAFCGKSLLASASVLALVSMSSLATPLPAGNIAAIAYLTGSSYSLTAGSWGQYNYLYPLAYSSTSPAGGGLFERVTSCTVDAGTCVQDASGAYWQRTDTGTVFNAGWWGASSPGDGSANTAAFIACGAASANGGRCEPPAVVGTYNLAGPITVASAQSDYEFDGHFINFNQQTANTPCIKLLQAGSTTDSHNFKIGKYRCAFASAGTSSYALMVSASGAGNGFYQVTTDHIWSQGGAGTIGIDPASSTNISLWHFSADHISGMGGPSVATLNLYLAGKFGGPGVQARDIYQQGGGLVVKINATADCSFDDVERNSGTGTTIFYGESVQNCDLKNFKSEADTLNTNYVGVVELGASSNVRIQGLQLYNDIVNVPNFFCMVKLDVGTRAVIAQVDISAPTTMTWTSGTARLVCPDGSGASAALDYPNNITDTHVSDWDGVNTLIYKTAVPFFAYCASVTAYSHCSPKFDVPPGYRIVTMTICPNSAVPSGTTTVYAAKNDTPSLYNYAHLDFTSSSPACQTLNIGFLREPDYAVGDYFFGRTDAQGFASGVSFYYTAAKIQ